MKEIGDEISPFIHQIAKRYKVQAIGILPPTIPRNIQFLKELERYLNISLPKIALTKAYPADIPVAQKTLNKLSQRIKNARETIFIKNQRIDFENILLINDAVGSGATLNETAKKLKIHKSVKKIYGFAVVGSYKGFDVIKEV
jgi:orotate phosphoribosyltransferase-like protein